MPKSLFSLPLYESAIHQESKRHESNLRSTNDEHKGSPFAYQLKPRPLSQKRQIPHLRPYWERNNSTAIK